MEFGSGTITASTQSRFMAFVLGRRFLIISIVSALAATGLALYLSRRSFQVDIDVYLMGGRHALMRDLYTVQFRRPFLRFTYPPFAALVFLPMARVLSLYTAQTVWVLVNVAALFALIAMSIRLLKPGFDRALVVRLSLAALLPALLLNPVFLTVGLGQVNLILCVAVLWDLVGPRKIGRLTIPMGVATGIAAAIKLTPLIFLPYLFFTGRRKAAMTGSAVFGLCCALSFVVSPRASSAYWTRYMFESGRAGALFQVSDQNISSALSRVAHTALSVPKLLPVLAVVGAAGLAVAVMAYRRSSPFLGVLVCATTGLLISPITWTHHLVWVVPLIAWLLLADDRPRYGLWWATGVAVLFWIAPIWWVPTSWWPTSHPIEFGERGWQLVAGNSFFLGMVLFIVATSIFVMRRAWPVKVAGTYRRPSA